MTKKCICQICNCGLHKCPRNVKKNLGLTGETEYNSQYVPKTTEKRAPFTPTDRVPLVQPFVDDTTYRRTFVPQDIQCIRPLKQNGPSVLKTDGRMDFETTYRVQFIEKEGSIPQSAKPASVISPKAIKFEGTPTYRDAYKRFEITSRDPIVKPQSNLKFEGPFEGNTVHRSEFLEYKGISRNKAFKPKQQISLMDGRRFDGSSTYRSDFQQHEIECIQPHVPKDAGQITDMGHDRDVDTTYRKDYVEREPSMTKSFKPMPVMREPTTFIGQSTYDRDFKPWKEQVRRQIVKPKANLEIPVGTFDHVSEYDHQYQPKEIAPVVKHRKQESMIPSGKFYDGTTYRDSFVKLPLEGQTVSQKPKDSYLNILASTEGKFDGTSSHRQAFPYRETCEPPKPMKRPDMLKLSDGKFDDSSTYKMTFVQKVPVLCPARKFTADIASACCCDESRNHCYVDDGDEETVTRRN